MAMSDIRNQTMETTTTDAEINDSNDQSTGSRSRKLPSNPTTPSSLSLQYQIPVPSPQLNAAINAIQSTVEQMYRTKVVLKKIKASNKERDGESSHNDGESESDGDDDDDNSNRLKTMQVLFDQLQSSVIDQLQVLVKPVTWNEYEERFIRFDSPLRRKLRRSRNEGAEDFVSSSSSSSSGSASEDDDEEEGEELRVRVNHRFPTNEDKRSSLVAEMVEEEEEEEDEEDLLDLDAVSRVQDLRNQVRKSAEHTCSIQAIQMKRLDLFLGKEVQSWKTIIPEECKEDQQQKGINNAMLEKGDEEFMGGKNMDRLDIMQSSITRLLQTLKKLEGKLPEQLNLLSETLDTLDHSLKRKERQEGGGGAILSGTERAIISRVDTKRRKTKMEEKEEIENSKNQRIGLEPEQRFALFMANE